MKTLIVVSVFVTGALLLAYSATAYEQPKYRVISQNGGYEIREYEPYIVAETLVEGDFVNSGNSAFSILAGYIFGNNTEKQKMSMTAPVTAQPQQARNVKMNMTAPVTAQPVVDNDGPSGYTYQFVMERKFSLDTLPTPNDPRVTLREVPRKVVAVRTYSGARRGQNYRNNLEALMEDLKSDGIRVIGRPEAAFYNGPWTPPFLRRNEVVVEIVWEA